MKKKKKKGVGGGGRERSQSLEMPLTGLVRVGDARMTMCSAPFIA